MGLRKRPLNSRGILMPSPISKIDRRLFVAQGTCGYCGKRPLSPESKSKCQECLDYQRAYVKGKVQTHLHIDTKDAYKGHVVYQTESGKASDTNNITYYCELTSYEHTNGSHMWWEVEERFKVERADGKMEWAVVKWRF